MCAFIAAEKTTYGVRRLCRVFGISPTTFYAWARRRGGPTSAELEDAYATNDLTMRASASPHLGRPPADRGDRRPRPSLEPQAGGPADANRCDGGVHRRRGGKYGKKTGSTATAPDLVQCEFTAAAPNQLWVGDITYLRSWEGSSTSPWSSTRSGAKSSAGRWRTIYAPSWSSTPSAWPYTLAPITRCCIDRLNYTSYEFGKTLRSSGLLAWRGRVGSAYDNAMAESVFATLKTELIYRQS